MWNLFIIIFASFYVQFMWVDQLVNAVQPYYRPPDIIVRRVNKCNENDYYLNFCIQFCVGILFMCLFC